MKLKIEYTYRPNISTKLERIRNVFDGVEHLFVSECYVIVFYHKRLVDFRDVWAHFLSAAWQISVRADAEDEQVTADTGLTIKVTYTIVATTPVS